MILTEYIEIKICYKNKTHYENLGYNIRNGDKITVPIKHLSPQSNIIVKVKCDVCGRVKDMKYQTYMKSYNNGGYYACSSKCAWEKNRKINNERYGGDSPLCNKEIQEKAKKTTLEKYGVENISQSEYFKDKYKETMIERYGVENGFQSEIIKDKIKETNINKYGYEHHFQNQIEKEKYLYGNKNPSYIDGRSYKYDIWNGSEGKTFKKKIFGERERKCICCDKEIRRMEIHHLYSRNTHPHLIFNKYNVVIICKN